MTNESWYTIVDSNQALTQGDMVFDCPLMAWKPGPIELSGQQATVVLKGAIQAVVADVISMTQACDLEQGKVRNVTLCPHLSLNEFRNDWEAKLSANNQLPATPNKLEKSWARFCTDIRDGHMWNLAMLNLRRQAPLAIEHRIVDFHEVFTVPRSFLESFVRQRGGERLQLLSPYREHLSQAFARFFMRVGLPTNVETAWQA
jgi:hypothetical protein